MKITNSIIVNNVMLPLIVMMMIIKHAQIHDFCHILFDKIAQPHFKAVIIETKSGLPATIRDR